MSEQNIRKRFESALAGEPIDHPVYAVYDWFAENRLTSADWEPLFDQGLGQINHARLIKHEHPGFEIVETQSKQGGEVRRDVRLVTDRGELHEWYLGEWKQEHFIKTSADYATMAHALEGVRVMADEKPFLDSEASLGNRGITVGELQGIDRGRTPLMALQVDWVGLEQFSMDLADELPELENLLEVMKEIKLEEIRQAVKTPVKQIKLWENLSIETLGPTYYQRHLVPLYKQILEMMNQAGKRLLVHYDGQLKAIADDIANLDIDGIDSFTEPPEGNLTTAEARNLWPDKFLWQNINLGWYEMPKQELRKNIERVIKDAGHRRQCLMISEEVPQNWQETVPFVLETLRSLEG